MFLFIVQPNRQDLARIYLQLQLFLATTLVTQRKEVPKQIHQTLQQRVNQGIVRHYSYTAEFKVLNHTVSYSLYVKYNLNSQKTFR